MFQLVLRCDLNIHDAPSGRYDDNHELSFEEAYLEVFDRQMFPMEGLPFPDVIYDEDTEALRRIDRYPIRVKSFEDIQMLSQMIAE